MHKLQFSLLGLLGVVSLVAVGCAALANPNEWWCTIVTNVSLAALFVAVLAAIYGRRAVRFGSASRSWAADIWSSAGATPH